jgi:ABC-type methionine transport system permease subunit
VYTTANGQTLLVKSDFGVVTLVDNSPLTADSGIVEAAMNQGNRQIAWSTDVLLPSTF